MDGVFTLRSSGQCCARATGHAGTSCNTSTRTSKTRVVRVYREILPACCEARDELRALLLQDFGCAIRTAAEDRLVDVHRRYVAHCCGVPPEWRLEWLPRWWPEGLPRRATVLLAPLGESLERVERGRHGLPVRRRHVVMQPGYDCSGHSVALALLLLLLLLHDQLVESVASVMCRLGRRLDWRRVPMVCGSDMQVPLEGLVRDGVKRLVDGDVAWRGSPRADCVRWLSALGQDAGLGSTPLDWCVLTHCLGGGCRGRWGLTENSFDRYPRLIQRAYVEWRVKSCGSSCPYSSMWNVL